ncbi:hypothetical protein B0T26DRAFT_167619 [Lasiosphaeria miniovina]|uniref:Uncharacterized protein n=1 Tax=Lasiosphaeria miniovina TaxID=1954250 RepID=A0AA40B5Z5_9PEZI|nr:uncharacterized protein B0T26DRAFT_167619 [Lasiosphaeria miniovina]KAK0728354.1 hypothetical protein B0T26DRAFT_167619 [Lasiosphaeria miniovina]
MTIGKLGILLLLLADGSPLSVNLGPSAVPPFNNVMHNPANWKHITAKMKPDGCLRYISSTEGKKKRQERRWPRPFSLPVLCFVLYIYTRRIYGFGLELGSYRKSIGRWLCLSHCLIIV